MAHTSPPSTSAFSGLSSGSAISCLGSSNSLLLKGNYISVAEALAFITKLGSQTS